MASVSNWVSTAIYNRLSQSPPIQTFSAGLGCLRQGKHLLCDPDSSPAPSTFRKIGRKVAGVALLAGGLAGLYYGAEPLVTSSIEELKSAYLFGKNPGPSIAEDQYERTFREHVEELSYKPLWSFRDGIGHTGIRNPSVSYSLPSCPLQHAFKKQAEVLFLGVGVDSDHHHSMDISSNTYLRQLHDITKLNYKIIRHPLQICEEIQSASKYSLIEDLFINAHGSKRIMGFSPTSVFKVFDQLPAGCFDGLSAAARIFLLSCSTGENSLKRPNVAEWISWISGREVVAPSAPISGINGECSIHPDSGRLGVRLLVPANQKADIFEAVFGPKLDLTQYFNTTGSWQERAIFCAKMVAPTFLGTVATWQMMRLGATVLQGGGAAGEWMIDKSAAPIRKLAEKCRLYNPNTAKILYSATKGTSQILNAVGKKMHWGMDKLIQPVNRLGSWGIKKSISLVSNTARRLFSRFRRNH